jgi:hypothetical protein
MSDFPQSARLLQRVIWRMYAVKLARRTFVWFVVAASVYAIALLTARLTGLITDVFTPQTLWFIPGAALILGLLTTRRPHVEDAARRTDTRQGTKDLFLTLTMLDRCAGEYKPLVAHDAEQRAKALKADTVVPFDWHKPSLLGGLVAPAVIGVLALGILFLPALDPFAVQAQAKEQETLAQRVSQTRKETELRKTQLTQQKDLDNENSEEVAEAIEKLQADFQKMRKDQKIPNATRLAEQQKQLGEKWRKLNAEQLKDLMNEGELDQRFGGEDAEQMREWQRELQQGSSESMEQALEELKEDLQELAKTDDPVERSEIMRKIEKQLREMSDFATDKAGSPQLAAALQRALDQMESMQNSESAEIEAEALEGLQESLDLSQMEAQELAQAARDMKSLEEALRLISMAKQLNSEEMLDGEAAEGAQTLEDYAAMYEQMMADMEGMGELGGEGFGEGGEAPEDDSVETEFVDETSKSAIQKGKILLSMKTKGMSDSGEAQKEYRQALEDVKQGVAEAIEAEEIPPGYVDAIQTYFDKIEAVDPALNEPGEAEVQE